MKKIIIYIIYAEDCTRKDNYFIITKSDQKHLYTVYILNLLSHIYLNLLSQYIKQFLRLPSFRHHILLLS